MPADQIIRDQQAEEDGIGWLVHPQHQGIADRLDMGGTLRQLGVYGGAEIGDQICRLLVAVSLGQGSKAGDIGKEESGRDLALVRGPGHS